MDSEQEGTSDEDEDRNGIKQTDRERLDKENRFREQTGQIKKIEFSVQSVK